MSALSFLTAAAFVFVGQTKTAPDIDEALQRGTSFLLRSQNSDGSWGNQRNALPIDLFGWNFEDHHLTKRAVTALASLALMEVGEGKDADGALRRAIEFLLLDPIAKRPSDWEIYNTWSYVYCIQAFARAHGDARFADPLVQERLRRAGEREIRELAKYQTPAGGWGYYDFETFAQRPSWATSFTTAAALIALLEAKDRGFSVEAEMLERAADAVARCRLPSGAYTYSVQAIPRPGGMEWIDQVKGSLGRIQVGNVALRLAGHAIGTPEIERGLALFFDHHKFLDIARKKPIPHEAYYLNSGYFYFFGHHYAAMAIELLSAERRGRYAGPLANAIVSCQEKDGSFWDWFLNDYAKPYATSFALMALGRIRKMSHT